MPDNNDRIDDIWKKIGEPWEVDRRPVPVRPSIPTPFPMNPIDRDITKELADILEDIRKSAGKQKKNPRPKKNKEKESLDRDKQENGPTIQEEF